MWMKGSSRHHRSYVEKRAFCRDVIAGRKMDRRSFEVGCFAFFGLLSHFKEEKEVEFAVAFPFRDGR
jgi:hypothetical protein